MSRAWHLRREAALRNKGIDFIRVWAYNIRGNRTIPADAEKPDNK